MFRLVHIVSVNIAVSDELAVRHTVYLLYLYLYRYDPESQEGMNGSGGEVRVMRLIKHI